MKEIEERRSVRKYLDKKVEKEKLEAILESARLAPSGSNTQPWRFLIVESEETKQRIVKADHNQTWMMEAPIFLVVIADMQSRVDSSSIIEVDENSSSPELKQIIRDTAIAIEHILLEAQHQGLSTCWTGWYEQKDIRPILGIPKDKYVSGVITLGYSDEKLVQRPRKELMELIRYEKWD